MGKFNVRYTDGVTFRYYCLVDVSKEQAEKACQAFKEKYVGKPYPNGMGWYPFRDPVVVEMPDTSLQDQ